MDQDVRLRTHPLHSGPYSEGTSSVPPLHQGPAYGSSYPVYSGQHAAYPDPQMHYMAGTGSYGQPYVQLPPPAFGQQPMGGEFFDTSSVTNQMVMSFGVQYGQKVLRRTQDNFSRYLFSLDGLRYYFTVNNSYVKNKIKVLLFPLRHKFRRREVDRQTHFEQQQQTFQHYQYLPAVEDVNAPDLYIPLMSFITYILLFGLLAGLRGKPSSPELLLNTGTSCLMLLLLELIVLRLACYIFPFPKPIYTMDLLCLCSYKYVGATICLLLRTLLSPWIYTTVWLLLASFHGFFMCKSLQMCLAGGGHQVHTYALYCLAALQLPIFMWLLHS